MPYGSISIMKSVSTLSLKAMILFMGALVLFLCIFVLPKGIATTGWDGYRPLLLGMYVPAIPFFIGLYQAFNLLRLIDKNKAFSRETLRALNTIKYCGIAIGVMYGIGLPYIYRLAQMDDAPGVMMIGIIFTFAPIIIAVFAAVLQKMFQNTMDIKSENELTV